jgi:hypothetical protein
VVEEETEASGRQIILGKTQDGRIFRPSDWAERLCGHLSTFRNRRIYFSRLLRPAVRDGIKCVIVEPELRNANPKTWDLVQHFAQSNNLQTLWEEEH